MTRNETILKYYYLVRQTLIALKVEPENWDEAWSVATLALVEGVRACRGANLKSYLIGCMRYSVITKIYRGRELPDAEAARACHSKRFGDVDARIDGASILSRLRPNDRDLLVRVYLRDERIADMTGGEHNLTPLSRRLERRIERARARARRLA